MNARRRNLAIAGTVIFSAALVSCSWLPRALRDEIAAEHSRLQQAERQLQHSSDSIRDHLAKNTDLFAGSSVAAQWPNRLSTARDELDRAKKDDEELAKISNGSEAERRHAEVLLSEERRLRQAALRESEAVDAEAGKWLDFQSNAPRYLAKMQQEYDEIRAVDLGPVAAKVQQAEQDWPAKKSDLDSRLAALRQTSDTAAQQWKASEPARQEVAKGKPAASAVATLIQTDDALAADQAALTGGANDLSARTGQLYNVWDKILTDLDQSREGPDTLYREKIKTVNTHFTDFATKKTEVSTDEKWTDVSAGAYRSVENDLGMAIGHKDAGQYDSEATSTAQPPGFAYVATPEQGRNQYGYWSQAGGQSVWTFLPEYFLMRQLLWGPGYRPILMDDYHGYQTARQYGRTYYGNETPAAPPKYGSHGTFTEQRYSSSRYVQSGGFRGSGYSSGGGAAESARTAPGMSRPQSMPGDSAGKRFGFGSGSSTPSGRRFGSGGGMPRMPGRSFGGRRR